MTDNTIKHTDIKRNGWIGQFLPAFLQPYAVLARLDRPIGIWLLLLPGWWAIALASGGLPAFNAYDLKLFIAFGVGAVIMRAAGCIINDLWDRKLDRQVARTRDRPLASGEVSVPQAIVFLFILLFLALGILLGIPSLVTVLLGFLAVPFIVLYPLMKRITWWPQLFLGLIFNFGALMGWSAVTGLISLPALFLYAGGVFWTLGYDTIYAHQDKEDDLRIGIKSTALKLGDKSQFWVIGFYAAAWFLFVLAFAGADVSVASKLMLFAAAGHFFWQIKEWEVHDPASSLRIFRSNRDFGLIILAAALI